MTVRTPSPHSRRTTALIVGALVLVVAVVAVIALLTAGRATPRAAGTTAPVSVPTASSTTSAVPSSSPTASSTGSAPTKRSTPAPVATASAPQPTKTAAISSPAPITKSLGAAVVKTEAVQGEAQGPGEIAGPAVRFTIRITNDTGKRFVLSNTVVNAYYGKAATPANQLQGPGGKPFPASIASGSTATGVFVFTIPRDQRAQVQVTVDTSVNNPVVAFRGSAPR